MSAGIQKGLQWNASHEGVVESGQWICGESSPMFISQTSMHPCALPDQKCCQANKAAVGVVYVSNLWDMAASVELTFEVWPTCGDGMSVHWTLTHGNESTTLFSRQFTATADSPPHRETIEKSIALFPGDSLMFLVNPGTNHECDGVYVHDIKVWQSS